MAATAATLARVRDDLVRIVHRTSGLPAFARDMGSTLRHAVPFEGVCLLTVDPATLLPTAEIVQNGLPAAARERLTEIEVGEADVNKFAALAGGPVPAASLRVPPGSVKRAACASARSAGRTASPTSCGPCSPVRPAAGAR